MINITELKESDKGRWVIYTDPAEQITAASTDAGALQFTEEL